VRWKRLVSSLYGKDQGGGSRRDPFAGKPYDKPQPPFRFPKRLFP
jgi:hypothetical protein